ncbi:MAG TPA: sigma factor-like helix-turn-helix DNA-binding protein [Anaerolineales bacterium]|nr:sigma factor-like helix-turn-helix DNA-binding protein [Anaerolineales bacterium]
MANQHGPPVGGPAIFLKRWAKLVAECLLISDSYRAVILLYDMHELTAPEIARLLSESLSTVKIRLHRARLKLRAALQAGCDFSYDEGNVLTCESKG